MGPAAGDDPDPRAARGLGYRARLAGIHQPGLRPVHGGLAPQEPWYAIFGYALPSTYLLLLWSGLYFGIKHFEALQQQREAALKAAALAQEAQVKMLRYQLNPHFLFNTLNAISTLILDGQSKVANLAVTRLSDFLRYTLDKDPMKRVSLRQEIDALTCIWASRSCGSATGSSSASTSRTRPTRAWFRR